MGPRRVPGALRSVAGRRPGERRRLPDVLAPQHPPEDPLDADAEARVGNAAVAAKVEVPVVLRTGRRRSPSDARRACRPTSRGSSPDDLAVPLGGEEVGRFDGARVSGRLEHVERLEFAREAGHEDRGPLLHRERGFLRGPEVGPPGDVEPLRARAGRAPPSTISAGTGPGCPTSSSGARPSSFSSFGRRVATSETTVAIIRSMNPSSPSRSHQASSTSRWRYSVRWRGVRDFSARNDGVSA